MMVFSILSAEHSRPGGGPAITPVTTSRHIGHRPLPGGMVSRVGSSAGPRSSPTQPGRETRERQLPQAAGTSGRRDRGRRAWAARLPSCPRLLPAHLPSFALSRRGCSDVPALSAVRTPTGSSRQSGAMEKPPVETLQVEAVEAGLVCFCSQPDLLLL